MASPKSPRTAERTSANLMVSKSLSRRSFCRRYPRNTPLAPTEQGSMNPRSPRPKARASSESSLIVYLPCLVAADTVSTFPTGPGDQRLVDNRVLSLNRHFATLAGFSHALQCLDLPGLALVFPGHQVESA